MTTSLLNSLLRALLRWGAALVFCLPLRHRPHFWARAEQTPPSLAATILIGQFYFITLLYFQSELFKKSAMEDE